MIFDLNHFADVATDYRTIPFWSWNDDLDAEELVRQVHAMHQAGIGGFFMHARSGLKTEYMSSQWFQCIERCTAAAVQLGMIPYLYDEIGWPSGFGAGLVNQLGEAYCQKSLRCRQMSSTEAKRETSSRILGFYSADGSQYLGNRPGQLPDGVSCDELLCIDYEVNNYYVDTLDPAVTEQFIRVTHAKYLEMLSPETRQGIRGFFTDEPQVVIGKNVYSPYLFRVFQNIYPDMELIRELPKLFLDLPHAAQFRIRFHRLVAELFSANYTKQIADFCHLHNWQFTGHQVQEVNYAEQVSSNGAVMPHYAYYDTPGVDWLGRVEPDIFVFTQLASMAAQFGKKRTMVETFALCGWNLNFSGMKHFYSQMQLMGANFLCAHLQSYSLKGMRKRDYPPSLFVHQPWWEDYRQLNDEFARVNQVLAEGQQEVRVLILHAQSSAWALYCNDMADKKIQGYFESIHSLSDILFRNNIAFHYASEMALESAGAVTEDGRLRLGECVYDLVILPELNNFTGKVFELLSQLSHYVCRYGVKHHLLLDGLPAPAKVYHFFNSLIPLPPLETLKASFECCHIENAPDLRVTKRVYDDCECFFFVNTSMTQKQTAKIDFKRDVAHVRVLDPVTGNFYTISHTGSSVWHHTFEPQETSLVQIFFASSLTEIDFSQDALLELPAPAKLEVPLNALARLRLKNDNFLVLDRCSYQVDDKQWIDDDVSVIQNRLLALRKQCHLRMKFHFQIREEFDLQQPLAIMMEEPERFQGALNGRALDLVDAGSVFDHAFRRVPLPGNLLRHGDNELLLETDFVQSAEVYESIERAKVFESEFNRLVFDMEIESIALMGQFGVFASEKYQPIDRGALRQAGSFEIGKLPEMVAAGTLAESGLPFFAGKLELDFKLTLPQTFSERSLRFQTTLEGANSVAFALNGTPCGNAFFPPFRSTECHDSLRGQGDNIVTLTLTTSLRNLLGPFHLAEGESYSVGIFSFSKESNGIVHWGMPEYDARYCVVALGVTNATALLS